MSEAKTYIVPDNVMCQGGNNDNLATMAMMSNGGLGGNGMWNNPFMYLVWMWMMRWMNGQGECNGENGNAALQRQIQTLQENMQDNHNSDLIMAGINGNREAIREVASNLGCDMNVLQQAVNGVSSSIQQLGGQVGFSAERIINAVNQGDCNVIQALKDCCCLTLKSIVEMGYQNQLANERLTYLLSNSINQVGSAISRGFCDTAYETLTQTCSLQNTIRDTSNTSTTAIIAKLDAMQNQALLDKIDALREKNSQLAVVINNAQLSALFGQMINAAVNPINSALCGISKEVAEVQCKLPNTVTLPYSCATAVPNCVAYNYGLYGAAGLWG